MSTAVSFGSNWRNAKDLKCLEGCQALLFMFVAAAENTASPEANWIR